MSAALKTLEALEVDVADVVVPERRRRVRDPIRSAVKTAPGGKDRHVHCAMVFGDDGEGFTTPGPDGHIHKVHELEIVAVAGHGHGLSATRCLERHDPRTGRHVQARR